jgi:cytochrome P450
MEPGVHFDPFAYGFHEDPYPVYRALRDQAPVYRNEELRFCALSRHADVLAAFKDAATFSNAGGISLEMGSLGEDASEVLSFLGMDPPRHTRMRGLVSKGFTPRRVAGLEPRIRELAVGTLERAGAGFDFVADFAGRIPMDVVSELLGVPVEDRDELRRLADLVLHREPGLRGIPPEGIEASGQLLRHFAGVVAQRRRRPGEDLASALCEAELDGARLADRDVIAFLYLMIIAGNETTTKLLANAVYWLQRNPDARAALRADAGLVPAWVEETLRYDNSTQLMARTATRDVRIHGEEIRKDEKVLLLIGSANRDERVFPDPDRYDLRRDTSEHLSFGRGIHFCLGASLARLEARVALEELWRLAPGFAIDETRLERVHSTNVRGFWAMPMALGR